MLQDVSFVFGYAPLSVSQKGVVERQLKGLKIFKITGYIPPVGFLSHAALMTAFSCSNIDLTKREWALLSARTLLTIAPPLLVTVDLVVTVIQNRLIEKTQLVRFIHRQNRRLSHYDSFLQTMALNPQSPQQVSNLSHQLSYRSFQRALREQNPILITFCLKRLAPEQLKPYLERMNNFRVVFGDKVLYTHRALLKDYLGSYFEAAINAKMKEASKGEIHLPTAEYSCFIRVYETQLLNTDLPLMRQRYQDYLILSHKYDFPRAKNACEQWIFDHSAQFNAQELFDLACHYELEKIKTHLIEQVLYKHVGKTKHPLQKLSFLDKRRLHRWLPAVKHLNLRFLITEGDANRMVSLIRQCRSLETLTLWTRDEGLLQALHSLPKLKSLHLILERDTTLEAFRWIEGLPLSILDIRKMQLCPAKRAIIASLPPQKIHFT
ncbi:MAG: hypothetical protein ACSNEK_08945 [Parachlamydiaceae bacterium]